MRAEGGLKSEMAAAAPAYLPTWNVCFPWLNGKIPWIYMYFPRIFINTHYIYIIMLKASACSVFVQWNLVNTNTFKVKYLLVWTTLKSPGIITPIHLATVKVKFLLIWTFFNGPVEIVLTRFDCTCIAGFNVIRFYNQEIRWVLSWTDRLVRTVGWWYCFKCSTTDKMHRYPWIGREFSGVLNRQPNPWIYPVNPWVVGNYAPGP